MTQFKRAQVMLLPTENRSNIVQSLDKTKLIYISKKLKETNNLELYIISDDEIKEGDWIYDTITKNRVEKSLYSHKGLKRDWKKIIATTDTSLEVNNKLNSNHPYNLQLPQPSQQFIKKYIESYNKDNIITDVLVEYEEIIKKLYNTGGSNDPFEYLDSIIKKEKLKINPKDNTITIKKLKDSWNSEEVRGLLIRFHNEFPDRNELEKWINKNL